MEKDMGKEMEMEVEMEDEKEGGIMDHEVECAAQDLLRAEKIKQNPELFKKAKEFLASEKKTIDAITSIEDLKKIRNKKMKEE